MIALSAFEASNATVHTAWQQPHTTEAESFNSPFCVSTTQCFGAGDAVFFEGDPCVHLYEVAEGVLRLYKLTPDGRRQITGFLYPGQLFGLNVGGIYAYTAECVTKVKLSCYPRAKLEAAIESNPRLARRFLRATVQELSVAQDQMLLLGRKTAIEKVASFLVRLSDQSRERGDDPEELYLPMTRMDIGDYLGLTTETVSRSMTRLKTTGVICLRPHGRVCLRVLDQLMYLADGDDCQSAA